MIILCVTSISRLHGSELTLFEWNGIYITATGHTICLVPTARGDMLDVEKKALQWIILQPGTVYEELCLEIHVTLL